MSNVSVHNMKTKMWTDLLIFMWHVITKQHKSAHHTSTQDKNPNSLCVLTYNSTGSCNWKRQKDYTAYFYTCPRLAQIFKKIKFQNNQSITLMLYIQNEIFTMPVIYRVIVTFWSLSSGFPKSLLGGVVVIFLPGPNRFGGGGKVAMRGQFGSSYKHFVLLFRFKNMEDFFFDSAAYPML